MSKKTSRYQNEDGTFKEMQRPGSDHASAFNGCVLHMTNEEGHSEDSAKRICGAIAQKVGAGGRGEDGGLRIEDGVIGAARMTGPLNIVPGGSNGTVVIQYMPPGEQTVSPMVNGEPMEMKVNVKPHWAGVFERANQSLLAKAKAGLDNEPFTDFNHDDDRASSKPQRYFWGGDDPKTGGVLLETKLTASGKSAITKTADTDPDYSSFSPQWIFHKKTFEPLGLPINQGAFVNRAAFKTIGKLPVVSAKGSGKSWALGTAHAADGDPENPICTDCGDLSAAAHKASAKAMTADDADAFNAHSAAYQAHKEAEAANRVAGNDDEAEHHADMMDFHKKQASGFAKKALAGSREPAANNNNTKGNEMTKEEVASAVASAFAAPEFATAVKNVIGAEIKPLKEQIVSLETERKNDATARAKAAVQKHVDRGAIAPQDKDAIADWESQYVADPDKAERMMGRLASAKGTGRITSSGGGTAAGANTAVEPEDVFMAKAKEFGEKNKLNETDALIAFGRTAEGAELQQQFRDKVRSKQ